MELKKTPSTKRLRGDIIKSPVMSLSGIKANIAKF